METSPPKKIVNVLFTTASLVALEIIFQVSLGYLAGDFMIIAFTLILSFGFYVAMLIYIIAIAWSTINIYRKLIFVATWFLLVLVGLIPRGHFVTLGALFSVYKDNPADVVADARKLKQAYEPMTCFGSPMRDPCDNPIPPVNLPLSIQKTFPAHVLILEDAVLIEKMGLGGLFRGFVVFPSGKDIWEDEPSIQLQKGCDSCWKIRIADGLYWYHATEVYPIKSMFSAEK